MDKKRSIMTKYMKEKSEEESVSSAPNPNSFDSTSRSNSKPKSENLSDSDDPVSPVKKKTNVSSYDPLTTMSSKGVARADASFASINDTINAFKAESDALLARDSENTSNDNAGASKRKAESQDFASKMMVLIDFFEFYLLIDRFLIN